MLQTAVEAARRAGQLIVEHYPEARQVTVKGFRDLVTDADIAAEKVILDLIRARFPEHAVVSEEAGGGEISSDYTWIVDPLDGTNNYVHRHPVFAVSIGLVKGGEPVIGVIHDPLRDQIFVAQKGRGARLNNALIYVSRMARLENAMVGLDWGHTHAERSRILSWLDRVTPQCSTLRVLGSAALAMAYVAAGWLDGYFSVGLKAWDAAAGMLMIIEAGGRCSTVEGKPYDVGLPGCLVTNSLIHDELLTVLHGNGGSDDMRFS